MFSVFKERAKRKARARQIYLIAAEQARLPVFYAEYGVPDNMDGRFEMVTLHVSLFIRALYAAGQKKDAQSVFDITFKITDKAIREMGIGDLSVPKHMKRMMKGFKGRGMAYTQALNEGKRKVLEEAVRRNVYGTLKKTRKAHVAAMADYIEMNADALSGLQVEDMTRFSFLPIANEEKKRA